MLIDGRYARGVKPISKVAVVDAVRVLEVGRVWCEGAAWERAVKVQGIKRKRKLSPEEDEEAVDERA